MSMTSQKIKIKQGDYDPYDLYGFVENLSPDGWVEVYDDKIGKDALWIKDVGKGADLPGRLKHSQELNIRDDTDVIVAVSPKEMVVIMLLRSTARLWNGETELYYSLFGTAPIGHNGFWATQLKNGSIDDAAMKSLFSVVKRDSLLA